MRALRAIWVAAVLARAPLAGAEGRPRYGGVVETALLGAPATLDPVQAAGHAELTLVELVLDTLYRTGPDGVPRPHLALGPPVVTGATVRIALRPGVRFHDGSELTPADVVASLARVRGSSARWVLAGIKAIRADATGLELTVAGAWVDVATQLALPATSITRGGRAPGERVLGTGPFRLTTLDRAGRRVVLDAFDDHFAGRPYLDRLVLRWHDTPDGEARAFETGAAHLSARGAAAFTGAQPKYRARDVESPAALLVYLGFGRAHAAVTDERGFRRALDLALARGALASVSSGERTVPTRSPVPVEAGGPGLAQAGRADDLPGARAALADAARRVPALAPARLAALQLEILVEDARPDDRELAERIAHALGKLGIGSVITAVAAPVMRDRIGRGACDLWIGQLGAPVTAAPVWWGAAFAAGGDPWAEGRLAAGKLDAAATGRAFAERQPIVPLLFRGVRLWHRTDVRGVGFDASGQPGYADVFLYGEPVRSKK